MRTLRILTYMGFFAAIVAGSKIGIEATVQETLERLKNHQQCYEETTMTRKEHIEWCKERALAYLPNELPTALASFCSDILKHDETTDGDVEGVRKWIEGFG